MGGNLTGLESGAVRSSKKPPSSICGWRGGAAEWGLSWVTWSFPKTLQCVFHHLAHFLDVLGFTLHVLALSGRIERESYSLVRNYTRQASVCLQPQPQYVLSRILYPILSIHQKNRPRRNTWRVPTAEVRFLRLCCAYRPVSKHGSRATVHILRQSTSSMTIHFFTYFISIDRPSLMETSVMVSRSWEGRNGTANYGGTNSHTFAEDGEA